MYGPSAEAWRRSPILAAADLQGHWARTWESPCPLVAKAGGPDHEPTCLATWHGRRGKWPRNPCRLTSDMLRAQGESTTKKDGHASGPARSCCRRGGDSPGPAHAQGPVPSARPPAERAVWNRRRLRSLARVRSARLIGFRARLRGLEQRKENALQLRKSPGGGGTAGAPCRRAFFDRVNLRSSTLSVAKHP